MSHFAYGDGLDWVKDPRPLTEEDVKWFREQTVKLAKATGRYRERMAVEVFQKAAKGELD